MPIYKKDNLFYIHSKDMSIILENELNNIITRMLLSKEIIHSQLIQRRITVTSQLIR